MRAKWWLISVLAVAAVGGGLALRRKPAPAPERNAVKVAPEIGNEVTVQGKVRPQHVIGVSAGVQGFVEAFMVAPGQDVYEGQVLARIGAQALDSVREGAVN